MDEDARAAWNEVGTRFTGLGQRLKTHFAQAGSAEPTPASDTTAEGADRAANEPSASDAVKDALRRVGEALDAAVTAIGASAKDPAITEEARDALKAVGTAMAATFGEVGSDLRRAFTRNPPSSDAPPEPPSGT